MNNELLATVLELARLGAVGVGAIVLLLAFFLLWKREAFAPENAKLISRYMTLGFIFAIAAGGLGLVPLFLSSNSGGPVPIRLYFSPNFASQKLRPPIVQAPDGTELKLGQTFSIPPSQTTQTVTVDVSDALSDVANLQKATVQLAASTAAATERAKVLADKVAETAPVPAAEAAVETQTQHTQQLHADVINSVKAGDFARANSLSKELQTSVLKTNPAITKIAQH